MTSLDTLKQRRESEIVRAILAYLRTVPGVVAWRANTGAVTGEHKGVRRFVRFGFLGMADIIGWRSQGVGLWRHAQFLAIEVKRPGEMATPQQQAFLDRVQDDGGIAFTATSVEDVIRGLGR